MRNPQKDSAFICRKEKNKEIIDIGSIEYKSSDIIESVLDSKNARVQEFCMKYTRSLA